MNATTSPILTAHDIKAQKQGPIPGRCFSCLTRRPSYYITPSNTAGSSTILFKETYKMAMDPEEIDAPILPLEHEDHPTRFRVKLFLMESPIERLEEAMKAHPGNIHPESSGRIRKSDRPFKISPRGLS